MEFDKRQLLRSRAPIATDRGSFVISTQPPIGGKTVRRRKPVKGGLVKKSRFYSKAGKAGKVVFDTKQAQVGRYKNLYKGKPNRTNLKTYAQQAEQLASNEVGRQGFGNPAPAQQAPIIINQGNSDNIDDRFIKIEQRELDRNRNKRLNENDISDLVNEELDKRIRRRKAVPVKEEVKEEDIVIPVAKQEVEVDRESVSVGGYAPFARAATPPRRRKQTPPRKDRGGRGGIFEWQESPIDLAQPDEADFTDVDNFEGGFGDAASIANEPLGYDAIEANIGLSQEVSGGGYAAEGVVDVREPIGAELSVAPSSSAPISVADLNAVLNEDVKQSKGSQIKGAVKKAFKLPTFLKREDLTQNSPLPRVGMSKTPVFVENPILGDSGSEISTVISEVPEGLTRGFSYTPNPANERALSQFSFEGDLE